MSFRECPVRHRAVPIGADGFECFAGCALNVAAMLVDLERENAGKLETVAAIKTVQVMMEQLRSFLLNVCSRRSKLRAFCVQRLIGALHGVYLLLIEEAVKHGKKKFRKDRVVFGRAAGLLEHCPHPVF